MQMALCSSVQLKREFKIFFKVSKFNCEVWPEENSMTFQKATTCNDLRSFSYINGRRVKPVYVTWAYIILNANCKNVLSLAVK